MPQSWLHHQHQQPTYRPSGHNPSGYRSNNYRSSSDSGTNMLIAILLLCILAAAGYYGYRYWKGDFKEPSEKTEDAENVALNAKADAACEEARAKVFNDAAAKETLEKNGTCSDNTLKTKSKCEAKYFCSDSTALTKDTCEAIADATWSPHVWTPTESFISESEINANDPFEEQYMSYGDFM